MCVHCMATGSQGTTVRHRRRIFGPSSTKFLILLLFSFHSFKITNINNDEAVGK